MNKLTLEDLLPEEAALELSGKKFTLNRMTLRGQVWLKNKFKSEDDPTAEKTMTRIFSDQAMEEISEIAFFLIKEKDQVKSVGDFQDLVVTQADRKKLIQALLTTLGISQPIIDKLAKQENAPGNEQPIGGHTST